MLNSVSDRVCPRWYVCMREGVSPLIVPHHFVCGLLQFMI